MLIPWSTLARALQYMRLVLYCQYGSCSRCGPSLTLSAGLCYTRCERLDAFAQTP